MCGEYGAVGAPSINSRAHRYDAAAMSSQITGQATVRPLTGADVDAAAGLLAHRHRRHRLAEPLLDPAFEDPAATRREIEALLALDGAAGWIAERDGSVAGYLIGTAKDERVWGRNAWVEAAGHAATGGDVVRTLYAAAANAWAADERFNHHVLVPASDSDLVDAWFSLDFGQQHLHAVREAPSAAFGVVPRSELVVRRMTRDDLPAVAELELVLPRHMVGAPVFSRLPIQPVEEVLAELEADWDDPKYTIFVAEHEGRVVGDAIAVDVRESPMNGGLVSPASAGFLGYAAVFPDARGLGAGRALGETVLAWARDAGFPAVVTDWRSANIEADRAWRGLGFRPTFRRLHRSIF
jgi:GNAT superfamily N-acetyltransferase